LLARAIYHTSKQLVPGEAGSIELPEMKRKADNAAEGKKPIKKRSKNCIVPRRSLAGLETNVYLAED